MRRISIVVAMLGVVCGLLAAYVAAPASATGCISDYVCSWTGPNFTGTVNYTFCSTGTHPLDHYKFSASNNCINKKNFLRYRGTSWQLCMNPTGERPNPGEFNDIDIGAWGSRC